MSPADYAIGSMPSDKLSQFVTANYQPMMYSHPYHISRLLKVDLTQRQVFELFDNPRFFVRINRWLVKGFGLNKDSILQFESGAERLLLCSWKSVELTMGSAGLVCCYRSFNKRLRQSEIAAITQDLGDDVVAHARQLRLKFEDLQVSREFTESSALAAAVQSAGRQVLANWLATRSRAFQRRFALRMVPGVLPAAKHDRRSVELFEAAAQSVLCEVTDGSDE
ncbi:MAG: hypothetical protein HWE20_15160 [Gammaproteobacteria bacterium]|nr:hypothetical protein [Gammaproteobacteria bacterium]